MGQIFQPGDPGIKVRPIDRESGPGAGAGASGNNAIFLGANAGFNSVVSNVIAIGNNTANAGIADVQLNGTTVLGAQNLQALTQAGATVPGLGNALTIIGQGNLNAQTRGDSTVVVGQGILPNNISASLSQSVILGNAIGASAAAVGVQDCVLIGYNVMPLAVNFGQQNVVAIGWKALAGSTSSIVDGVFIGTNVAPTVGVGGFGAGQNVIIGGSADSGASLPGNVVVGFSANARGAVGAGNSVVLGNLASTATADAIGFNVVVGSHAQAPSGVSGRNIILGPYAGLSMPAGLSNQLVIEQNVAGGGSQLALVYGDMSVGNLVLGNSTDTVNRDFGGAAARNIVKLINGVKGAAAPIGGGYFYATAGALHWVGSAGTDTTVAVA